MEKPVKKTNAQLLKEIDKLKATVSKLEKSKNSFNQVEEALKVDEDKFRSLIKNFPDVVWTTDIEGNTSYISDNVKDGKWIWLHGKALRTYEKDGINYADGVFSDITERIQIEHDLREITERYDLAINATKDGIFDWNLVTNEIYYSPSWKRILGYKDNELPNDFSIWENLTEPEDVKKSWKMQNELINKERDHFELEFKMKHKKGHWVDILSRADAVFDTSGKAIRIVGTHVDITDHKLAGKALIESEEKYRTIIETIPGAVYECDMDWTFLFISSGFKELTGYPVSDIINNNVRSYVSLMYEDDIKRITPSLDEALKRKDQIYFSEYQLKTKSGKVVWVRDSVRILYDTGGKAIGYKGVLLNITEQKKAEEELRNKTHEAQSLSDMFDSSNQPFAVGSPDGSLYRVNKAFCQLTGYSEKELLQSVKWNETLTPLEWRESEAKLINELLATGNPTLFEKEYIRKDGQRIAVELLMHREIDTDGNIENVFGFITDISERKQAEEALRKSEEKFRTLFENAPVMFGHIDGDGNYLDISNSVVKITGFSKDAFMGGNAFSFIHEDDLDKVLDSFSEVKKSGSVKMIYRFKHKNGHFLTMASTAIKIHETNTYFVSSEDISEREKAETELKMSESRLATAQEIGVIGTWNLDIVNDVLEWTDENYKIFGVKQGTPMKVGDFFNIVHPDDRDYVSEQWSAGMKGEDYDIEHRLLIDGKVKWVREKADVTFDENGRPVRAVGITQDITERKRTEAILSENTERIESFMNSSTDSITLYDSQLNIVDINTTSLKKFFPGIKKEEIVGKNILDISPDLKKSGTWAKYMQVIKTGKPLLLDNFIPHPKFGDIYLSVKVFKVSDGIGMITTDITEAKKAEQALKESEDFLNRTGEIAKVGGWHLNASFDKVLWTSTTGRIHELPDGFVPSLEEAINYYHPDDQEHVSECVRLAIEKGTPFEFDTRLITAKGNQRWVRAIGRPTMKDGKCVWLSGTFQDITEHKRIEEELLVAKEKAEESELRHRSLVSILTSAIWTTDAEGQFITPQLSFEEFTGQPWEEHKGVGWGMMVHPDDRERIGNAWADAVKNKSVYHVEGRMMRASGHYCHFTADATPVLDKDSNVKEWLGTLTDITERKKSEEELRDAMEKAEESDRLKSAFLANMSHEIRTPMNSILGFMDLLKEPDLERDEKDRYIGIVNESGERLLNTINDIIEISKIESGDIKVVNQEINIQELLAYYENFFLPATSSKGLQFQLVQSSNLKHVVIYSDKNKLDSIITNLINNAIKFTAVGSIEFGCEVNKDELLFFVKDTGVGIEKERQKAVFERFVHADPDKTRGYEGSGLGLSICKSFVEMLGGKIWNSSKMKQGTTFYFTIPLHIVRKENVLEDTILKEQKSTNVAPKPINKLKIAIVEDYEPSSLLLTNLLQRIDCEIVYCITGSEAVELCKSSPDIDIVLMDIRLPDMNGYEATKKIREFNKEVYIIAQTAYALAGDREKALDVGCDDYISKPIDKKKLVEMIEKRFGK